MFSLSLAKYTESFVCSVVLGKDVIPRLGMTTMRKLQTHIHRELVLCRQPKVRNNCCSAAANT